MRKGWMLEGNSDGLKLKKGKTTLTFNIKIPTPKGMLFGMQIKSKEEMICGAKDGVVTIDIQEAHSKLGHISFAATRKIAQSMSWVLTGKIRPCESCAVGKARRQNIVKRSNHKIADKIGQRIFIDLTSVKNREFPGIEQLAKPYWRILVDEKTQMKFTDFFETKIGMVEPTCEIFNQWENSGRKVEYVRCNEGGENKALQKRLKSSSWKMQPKFEFTGRNTPQRNHLAEISFHVLANRGRAMLENAGVPRAYRYLLWREAFKTATKLDSLVQVEVDGVTRSRHEHWYGKTPAFAKNLRIWGEAGAVTLKGRMNPKIENRGYICMFVGYPDDHAADTLRMWDPRSRRVHVTRDIKWLNRMYFENPNMGTDVGNSLSFTFREGLLSAKMTPIL